jgi:nicotinate dehydrogenase subunit A
VACHSSSPSEQPLERADVIFQSLDGTVRAALLGRLKRVSPETGAPVTGAVGKTIAAGKGAGIMATLRQGDLEITVNGQAHTVQADPETPLLYFLRNELKLNAAKFGCGLAQCGACTVHVDGEPVRSCVMPVSEVAGAEVTTLEGLGSAEALHPIQQAFIEEQAAQCGYCIPGMMMSAAALLAQNTQPNDADIREALSGNLCRCGTHVRILRAVQRAAGAPA